MRRHCFTFPVIAAVAAYALFTSGCTPTYPKEELPSAVQTVFKEEYNMDVEVTVLGSTIGIYYPMEGLLDVGLGISEESWDTISNLVLVASRVVLSTDADIKFYCVIAQDARLPELQVVIIKYVEDVKRSMYRNISRGESFKRTLFSVNLTPQAKKERSVNKVFEKLGVEEPTRQKIMDEFFRSPPTKLSDIGYWRDQFYIKDITLEEFLAAQIASRIKLEFKGEEKLEQAFDFKSAEAEYTKGPQHNKFDLKFKINEQKASTEIENLKRKKIQEILKIINRVVYGYKFKDFDAVVMEDQMENVTLSVSMQNVYEFTRENLPVEEIVHTSKPYF
ncbi:MAG: hypothetical protein GF408_07710 [Candidatus Omnitrophica bacterium]|nr:hypothetical protein [Candidatus Omnitrophota bacterium]